MDYTKAALRLTYDRRAGKSYETLRPAVSLAVAEVAEFDPSGHLGDASTDGTTVAEVTFDASDFAEDAPPIPAAEEWK